MTDEELTHAIKALPAKLDYFKRWRQNEYDLLNQRVTSFITCQSFLLTAYAVSYVNSPGPGNWFSRILLPILGCFLSIIIIFPIRYNIKTIDAWMVRHWEAIDSLWREVDTHDNPTYRVAMSEFLTSTDSDELLESGRYKATTGRDHWVWQFWRDPAHWYGLLFSRAINMIFFASWLVAGVVAHFNGWR